MKRCNNSTFSYLELLFFQVFTVHGVALHVEASIIASRKRSVDSEIVRIFILLLICSFSVAGI